MVSKCANPDCFAPFRYLHAGKLFRADTAALNQQIPVGRDDLRKKPPPRVVFYWLCEDCAAKMTLIFDTDAGVSVRPIVKMRSIAA